MDSKAYTVSAYLRIASIAVALYDYLETAPTAWQFYREQWRQRRISSSCVLFVLIRATSIAVLVLSSYGFFYSRFDTSSCQKFYLLPPAFKVLQGMVSQVILGMRAWNLSRRSTTISYLLVALYLATTVLQWVSTLSGRKTSLALDDTGLVKQGNCRAFSSSTHDNWGAWVYYLVAFLYDAATVLISVFFLLKYKRTSNNSMMNKVIKMMLYDGLFYFVALATINFVNLVFFKTSADFQTAAASLGYAVSWIMSQRMLIHLHNATRERNHETTEKGITITENLGSARDVSHAVRTQFEPKDSGATFDLTFPRRGQTDTAIPEDPDIDPNLSVQVRVERTVKLDRALRSYELEDYTMSSRQRR